MDTGKAPCTSDVNFNHISQDLSEEKIKELKKLFAIYKKLKNIKLAFNMSSMVLIVTGTIVGSVTLNPIVLGTISCIGILIQGYVSNSGLSNKVAHCKFAYTNYQKIMVQLKSYLRGMPYDEDIFLSDAKVVEDIVIDMCPSINGMSKKYNEIYGKL